VKTHYLRIRKVKTRSGSIDVQVGYYAEKRFHLEKHIGSSKDSSRLGELLEMAKAYVRSQSPQPEFNFNPQSDEILFKRGLKVTQSRLEAAYIYLDQVYAKLGFAKLTNEVLKHFVMIRVLEPASKSKSILLLNRYFGIHYKKTTIFRDLTKFALLKDEVQKIALRYAQKNLQFNFSLIFYDVTTLYFEAHSEDEFRRNGFSKDNKIGQPQVLIGLVVTESGFPIYYDIFKGNTYEGKTLLPIIRGIKDNFGIPKFTVVADAGMLSEPNLKELEANQIDYVVGARLGHISLKEIQQIASELQSRDQKLVRHGTLLYEYSRQRARKDKADHDKQIERAKYYLEHPSHVSRRNTFISLVGKKEYRLNENLILKHRLMEGIKGYRTNITAVDEALLVARYKDLWKIEQSFRIAKSDLEARPIYHRKEDSIKSHILIVFMALCLSRVIESETQTSIAQVMDELRDNWTLTLSDGISGNSMKINFDKKTH
jgi:transposase